MNLLEARGLSKSFGGVRALQDFSFSLSAGERLAMIGPNGAGKSTCFNLLDGQLRPDAGAVLFREKEIQGRSPRERCLAGIGRTFQVAAAFASMTVREAVQVAILARLRRIGSIFGSFDRHSRAESDRLLERVGIGAQAGRICAALAHGDLKRVEFAIALAGQPRLLLMDEPTAGMAPPERRELMDLIARISREEEIAVLFTEHDMDVVFAFADRVLVLAEGRLLAQGSPATVRADARVREAYLGEGADA